MAQTEKHRWNAVVDNYIAEGQDKRSRKEIEKAAKIDLWKGAWVKVCKGANCDKTFRDQVDKFSVCAKCKIVSSLALRRGLVSLHTLGYVLRCGVSAICVENSQGIMQP